MQIEMQTNTNVQAEGSPQRSVKTWPSLIQSNRYNMSSAKDLRSKVSPSWTRAPQKEKAF